jgi:hypothetical protein
MEVKLLVQEPSLMARTVKSLQDLSGVKKSK